MTDRNVKGARRNFPERLAALRGNRTQRGFALELGVFQQNINRYELGQSVPHFDFLVKVAMKEAVSLDWLIYGHGRMARGRA